MDRVRRPLDDYPYPGPNWYWTQTKRGALLLLAAGIGELLLTALAAFLAVWVSPAQWIVVVILALLGVPTVNTSAMSAYAHHRWPWQTEPAG